MSKNRVNINDGMLYTFYERGFERTVRKEGVPPSIDVMIKDTPSGTPGKWSLYIPDYHESPPAGEYVFPEVVYLDIPASYKIAFDFLGLEHGVRIVSEVMLFFLKEQGITKGYEVANAIIVNRKGEKIETDKNYFALRFYEFDDNLIDFNDGRDPKSNYRGKRDVFKICPNMRIKDGVFKEILVLECDIYRDTFVFTENIKGAIEKKGFITAEISPIGKPKN